MPKIVDHDERRRLIVATYLDLVVEIGFANANAKLVCQRLGMSVGSLWHYFDTFEQVIDQAALDVFARDVDRVKALTGEGLDGVCQAIEFLLPLDEATEVEAELIVSFWGQAPAREALRAHLASTQVFSEALTGVLTAAVNCGDLREHTPVALLTEALNQLLDGAQVAHVLDPGLPVSRRLARCSALVWPWVTNTDAPAAARLTDWLHETTPIDELKKEDD